VRYRFESSKKGISLKGRAGENRLLQLALIAVLPALASLSLLLLPAPRAAPQPAPVVVTPAVLAMAETPTPAATPVPSQPRLAIAAQPQVQSQMQPTLLSTSLPTQGAFPTVNPVEFNDCNLRNVPDGWWCISYYRDRDQDDEPVYVELRPAGDPVRIDWRKSDWPDREDIPRANFRIVFTGTFYFPETRSYLFSLRLQGSARAYIDNGLELDAYTVGNKRPGYYRRPVHEGRHPIRFEYYLDDGPASIYLAWQPDTNRTDYWFGRYYNNTTMIPPVAMIRQDDDLNFTWEGTPGQEMVNPDNFSVQWLRVWHVPQTGLKCSMVADDRVRVFIDGQLVPELSNWEGTTPLGRIVTLHAGRHFVEVHYIELGGLAQIHLNCSEN
jgi:hypothetical protein